MKKAILALIISAALMLGGAPLAEAHSRPRTSAGRSAPSAQTWDRLAQCESGGRWHIQGRKYSGGLQFDRQTWRSVGGTGTAGQASKQEQIERATALHAKRGFRPWPGCSRKLGLRG